MKIKVSSEVFEEIKAGRLNNVISAEEWSPMKGLLFLVCGDVQLIADVFECVEESGGRWLIIFSPISTEPSKVDNSEKPENPISSALEEVQKIPEKQKGTFVSDLRKMVKRKPYYIWKPKGNARK